MHSRLVAARAVMKSPRTRASSLVALVVAFVAACSIAGSLPTSATFDGTVYLGVPPESTRIEQRDLLPAGPATGVNASVRDNSVYALMGVNVQDAIVLILTDGRPQLFVRRVGPPWTHLRPGDVPGLCRYLADPAETC